jgi:hypothetical protein
MLWVGLALQALGCSVTALLAAWEPFLIPFGLALVGAGHLQATVGFTRLATAGAPHATGAVGASLSAAQQVGAGVGVALAVAFGSTGGRLLSEGVDAAAPDQALGRALIVLALLSGVTGLSILTAWGLGRRQPA